MMIFLSFMWDFTNDAALEFDVVSVSLLGGGGERHWGYTWYLWVHIFQTGPFDLFRFEFIKLV